LLAGVLALAAAQAAPAETLRVKAAVIQATNEKRDKDERYFDPRLDDETREAIDRLPFNTFRLKSKTQKAVAYDRETAFVINARYTLYLTPLRKDDRERVRVRIRIEEKVEEDDKVKKRDALETTTRMANGKRLVLGGLRLDDGELVAVLCLEITE
jgi:hypothetical protein